MNSDWQESVIFTGVMLIDQKHNVQFTHTPHLEPEHPKMLEMPRSSHLLSHRRCKQIICTYDLNKEIS